MVYIQHCLIIYTTLWSAVYLFIYSFWLCKLFSFFSFLKKGNKGKLWKFFVGTFDCVTNYCQVVITFRLYKQTYLIVNFSKEWEIPWRFDIVMKLRISLYYWERIHTILLKWCKSSIKKGKWTLSWKLVNFRLIYSHSLYTPFKWCNEWNGKILHIKGIVSNKLRQNSFNRACMAFKLLIASSACR